MAGLSPASTAAEEGSIVDQRSRAALLAWAAATLPFPTLALLLDGRPMSGAPFAVAIGSAALSLAWVAVGVAGFRSPAWPGRMFAASLAYLVLVFSLLLALGL